MILPYRLPDIMQTIPNELPAPFKALQIGNVMESRPSAERTFQTVHAVRY